MSIAALAQDYLLASVFAFGFLFSIWSKTGWFNICLKSSLFALTVIGVVVSTKTFLH